MYSILHGNEPRNGTLFWRRLEFSCHFDGDLRVVKTPYQTFYWRGLNADRHTLAIDDRAALVNVSKGENGGELFDGP